MKIGVFAAALALALAIGGTAHAASIDIIGPDKLVSAGNNDGIVSGAILDTAASGAPWFAGDGSGVRITFNGSYQVTWTFIGAESGYSNDFLTGGFSATETIGGGAGVFPLAGISTLGGAVPFTSDTVGYSGASGAFIPFAFTSPQSPSGPTTRSNGDAANDTLGADQDPVTLIFSYALVEFDGDNIVQVILTDTATDYFVAGFDDSGAGPDDDYDDFIVLGHVTPVPLPAALPLLGGALGLMGLFGWRRRRQAPA